MRTVSAMGGAVFGGGSFSGGELPDVAHGHAAGAVEAAGGQPVADESELRISDGMRAFDASAPRTK
ncbi:hypothetical protein OH768_06720 [Streptomyces sp. NBC_01622]|uniref:hypothetical protein n=1 Tax=Streptomyces sp. NBC_01622 TaxID=2975903 RepID=UPI0038681653|nr:hypothetical protein OH768_06720 [Streptomyces sp. NBC_01622]